jgi:hypothetical protein
MQSKSIVLDAFNTPVTAVQSYPLILAALVEVSIWRATSFELIAK